MVGHDLLCKRNQSSIGGVDHMNGIVGIWYHGDPQVVRQPIQELSVSVVSITAQDPFDQGRLVPEKRSEQRRVFGRVRGGRWNFDVVFIFAFDFCVRSIDGSIPTQPSIKIEQ